ncbi:hypothetical protein KY346_00535 [Candidatus Woesearchaeota archaeon]|nr:hypothetical protein [Candidatus Woesearchaeota archaeon]
MYETIKDKIKEVIEITQKCPENLQEKCFELLMLPLLQEKVTPSTVQESEEKESVVTEVDFKIPLDVRAFLEQYGVSEEKLQKLFLMQGEEVKEKFNITTSKKARAQIQLALLSALQNALKGEKFQFSIATVKQQCEDHKAYDLPNFRGIFKKNQGLFKNLDDDENVELSPSGKEKLAETILEVAK